MIVLPCRSRVQLPQETKPVSKPALQAFCFLSELLVSWLLTSASQYKNHVCKLTFFSLFFFSCGKLFFTFLYLLSKKRMTKRLPASTPAEPGVLPPSRNCMYFEQSVDVQLALDRLKILRSSSITACFSLACCHCAGMRCGKLPI